MCKKSEKTMIVFGFVCCIVMSFVNSAAAKVQPAVKTGTSFSCVGRPSGYYADVETGCQIYHMCDGLGRQFSYSCPNTTLFQQRMLICDHWYMVNCSQSELDYSANLLIGQRDKPFVDDTVHSRTPRPDLVSNPYAPRYRDSKAQDDNSINLIGAENQPKKSYFLPSHWSTELSTAAKESYTTESPKVIVTRPTESNNQARVASRKEFLETANTNKFIFPTDPIPLATTTNLLKRNNPIPEEPKVTLNITPPSKYFLPPFERSYQGSSNENDKFNSTAVQKQTALTLESLRPPPLPTASPTTTTTTQSPQPTTETVLIRVSQISQDFPVPKNNEHIFNSTQTNNNIEPPALVLLPPKLKISEEVDTSTTDPQSFYRIVPSKDLLPPKNAESKTFVQTGKILRQNSTDSNLNKVIAEKKIREFRKFFLIPDYSFPLDTLPRPDYNSFSSYQVNPSGNIRTVVNETVKKGEINPDCPNCDPELLIPGTCQPCILINR